LPQTYWEDMAQEAVLKTIVALAQGKVDMPRLDFDAWFHTVVQRVAINWWRLNRAYVPLEEADEPEDTQSNYEPAQILAGQDLQALLDKTPELESYERTILILTYAYGCLSREIAEILGERSAATVRARHARALKKLRTHLRRA